MTVKSRIDGQNVWKSQLGDNTDCETFKMCTDFDRGLITLRLYLATSNFSFTHPPPPPPPREIHEFEMQLITFR